MSEDSLVFPDEEQAPPYIKPVYRYKYRYKNRASNGRLAHTLPTTGVIQAHLM